MKHCFTLIISFLYVITCYGNTWYVGPSRTYTLPSQVRSLVADGDTIYIDGSVYANDAVKWNNRNLHIIGLGTATNRTILRYTSDIPNGKGIFVFELPGTCDDAYIENIVFDGAQVSNGNGANGAGIRYQANNLTINKCKFMNCQNGILEGHGSVTTSNVIILNSEFENNGYQLPNDPNYSGYVHHIYISASADTLMVQNCYFHHPRGQANSIKTRAQRSFILYNLIDEATGYGSWEINIAQGGLSIIMGNIIIQGPSGANHGIIGYDAATNPLEDFYFVNNTVINRFAGNIKYFNVAPSSGITTFKLFNNIFASTTGASNTFITGNTPGNLDTSHNIFAPDYLSFGFTNPSSGDYSLSASAISAINQGVDAGTTNTGYSLTPGYMYQSYNLELVDRTTIEGAIDIGAYEFASVLPVGLQNMSAQISKNDVHLTWRVNESTGINKFEVERSTNNISFRHIGTVISSVVNNYQYIDYAVITNALSSSPVYYRLKMMRNNGSYSYSKVVVVKQPNKDYSLKAYPNPFRDQITVQVPAKHTTKAVITLTDATGKLVKLPMTYSVSEGDNQLIIQPLQSLPKGLYHLTINVEANISTYTVKKD